MNIMCAADANYLRWEGGPESPSFHGPMLKSRSLAHSTTPEEPHKGAPSQPKRRPCGLTPWRRKRVVEYIRKNLAAPLKIVDVAIVAKLSPDYFSKAFKASFGVRYTRYLRARRLELGRWMMLSTDIPLCQIALACGLADQSHFTRLFRREVGVSPGEWRRRATRHITPQDPSAAS
jgi:AraC-like DNA-binding protein